MLLSRILDVKSDEMSCYDIDVSHDTLAFLDIGRIKVFSQKKDVSSICTYITSYWSSLISKCSLHPEKID